MLENNPHKKVSDGQMKKMHEDEIRASIAKMIELLEPFGREHHFQAYSPDLSVNTRNHTAMMSWGIDTDLNQAMELTTEFHNRYKDQLPRLHVLFLGNVNL